MFNDLAAKDPKKCANDAMLLVGMDKDHFRTGHTKVHEINQRPKGLFDRVGILLYNASQLGQLFP